MLLLGWAACATALALIVVVDVETVLGTGPVVLVSGVLTVIFGARARRPVAIAIGVAQTGVCALSVALVNLNYSGPGPARGPFIWVGSISLLFALGPTILGMRQARQPLPARSEPQS